MIRVLQCVAGMNRGGLETFTMNLLREIGRGVRFDFLVSFSGVFDREIEALGGRIFRIPFITQSGPLVYRRNLRRFFSEHPEYGIVHAQMDRFGGLIVKTAAEYRLPVRIVHSHSTKNEGNIFYRAVKDYYGRMVEKYATDLFACGRDAAEWMFGSRAGEARILRNGVDLEAFYPADERDASVFTVGHIGRFSKVKNHAFLIDVFKEVRRKHPASKLLLAGEGELRGAVEQRVRAEGLSDSVLFCGAVTGVRDFLARTDAVCMPSLFEGVPLSLIEAQSCGVPAVVSDRVSRESSVTGSVSFLPLRAGASLWADRLLALKGLAREDRREKLLRGGYSMRQVAAELQAFYLDAAKRITRTGGSAAL